MIAAVFAICPDKVITINGIDRTTGEEVQCTADTLKDVSDFCNRAIPEDGLISSTLFLEWVRTRDSSLADALPKTDVDIFTDMLRIQTIDPLSDINLCKWKA